MHKPFVANHLNENQKNVCHTLIVDCSTVKDYFEHKDKGFLMQEWYGCSIVCSATWLSSIL